MPDLYMSLERNLWLSLFGISHSVDDEYPFRSMVARSYHGRFESEFADKVPCQQAEGQRLVDIVVEGGSLTGEVAPALWRRECTGEVDLSFIRETEVVSKIIPRNPWNTGQSTRKGPPELTLEICPPMICPGCIDPARQFYLQWLSASKIL